MPMPGSGVSSGKAGVVVLLPVPPARSPWGGSRGSPGSAQRPACSPWGSCADPSGYPVSLGLRTITEVTGVCSAARRGPRRHLQ